MSVNLVYCNNGNYGQKLKHNEMAALARKAVEDAAKRGHRVLGVLVNKEYVTTLSSEPELPEVGAGKGMLNWEVWVRVTDPNYGMWRKYSIAKPLLAHRLDDVLARLKIPDDCPILLNPTFKRYHAGVEGVDFDWSVPMGQLWAHREEAGNEPT